MNRLPRDAAHDYSRTVAKARRDAVTEASGATLTHVGSFSFEPEILPGNLEGFSGVAQVPIGFAGPLRVNGEQAQGEFYVPLATTEGTLVASYNRGMRLTHEARPGIPFEGSAARVSASRMSQKGRGRVLPDPITLPVNCRSSWTAA